jgi:hypothetical protein
MRSRKRCKKVGQLSSPRSMASRNLESMSLPKREDKETTVGSEGVMMMIGTLHPRVADVETASSARRSPQGKAAVRDYIIGELEKR